MKYKTLKIRQSLGKIKHPSPSLTHSTQQTLMLGSMATQAWWEHSSLHFHLPSFCDLWDRQETARPPVRVGPDPICPCQRTPTVLFRGHDHVLVFMLCLQHSSFPSLPPTQDSCWSQRQRGILRFSSTMSGKRKAKPIEAYLFLGGWRKPHILKCSVSTLPKCSEDLKNGCPKRSRMTSWNLFARFMEGWKCLMLLQVYYHFSP